jgi:hypothetical protein
MRCTMLLIATLVGIVGSFSGCSDSGTPPAPPIPDDVVRATGTVLEQSAGYFLLEADSLLGNSQTRIVDPVNLPEAFKIDQLRVRFSGKFEGDPWVQYRFLPLRISFIERLLP